MAEILISGVKIPKKGEKALRLMIDSEGIVNIITYEDDGAWCKAFYEDVTAQELPPHGDLIDKSQITASDIAFTKKGDDSYIKIDSPVIIPASKGE